MSSPIILSLASMPVSFMGSPDFLCSPPKRLKSRFLYRDMPIR